MKILLFILLTIPVYGQNTQSVDSVKYFNKTDTVVSPAKSCPEIVCKERGHVEAAGGMTTLVYCHPRTVDLPDKTIKIYWDRNTLTTHCTRCGKIIRRPVQEKPDTVVIWQRE